MIIDIDKNTKLLEKAIIAETFPFDSAVKSILENVLNPTSSKANEKSLFPLTAILYALEPCSVKAPTNIFEFTIAKVVVTIETIPMKVMLIFFIFCNFKLSFDP